MSLAKKAKYYRVLRFSIPLNVPLAISSIWLELSNLQIKEKIIQRVNKKLTSRFMDCRLRCIIFMQ